MDPSSRCPECGTELPAEGEGRGPCPACLLKLGLSGEIPAIDGRAPSSEGPVSGTVTASPPPHTSSWRRGLAAAVVLPLAALAALAAVVLALFAQPPRGSPAPEMRFTILTPDALDPVSFAVSPDGRHVVFVAGAEGVPRLWLRPMGEVSAREMSGTDGASLPFWSPDSQHLGFFAGGTLRRIRIGGGAAQSLARAPQPCGGAWATDGTILFVPDCDGGIAAVRATGGEPELVTTVDGGRETGHRFPQLLPGGDRVLFFADGPAGMRGVQVLDRRDRLRRHVIAADAAAVYASQGYLLFVQQGSLFGQRFDAGSLETSGDIFPLSEELAVDSVRRLPALSTSAAGPVVYRAGSGIEERGRLTWFDLSGRMMPLDELDAIGPAVSPDGGRIAFTREVNGNSDIWVFDVQREVMSRLTFDAANDTRPVWSPDGRTLLFHSNREGAPGVYRKSADGSGDDTMLFPRSRLETVTDWSHDGRLLVFHHRVRDGWDISVIPVEGEGAGKPIPVLQSPFDETSGVFSPDGRWIAYQANESGRFEIFVRSFPDGESLAQITTEGGIHPRWSLDGGTLFWIAPAGALSGSRLSFPSRSAIQPERPFAVVRGLDFAPGAPPYDVAPSGFVAAMRLRDGHHPLTVLLNWQAPR